MLLFDKSRALTAYMPSSTERGMSVISDIHSKNKFIGLRKLGFSGTSFELDPSPS
ncbi:hypothetical protein LguiA_026557 [Lonicera macranthoides]